MTKPFINPRAAAHDKKWNPNDRTAVVGAGSQSVLMTVSPFSSNGEDGASIDLSWSDDTAPLLVKTDLANVAVPGFHFRHAVASHRTYLFAEECIEALAKIQKLMDKQEWGPGTLAEIADIMREADLVVREPEVTP
jgi:hypothetical protein|tara:strand:+ start:620 stop:1027 length:408 start_codon:yes stop_codon:yes gene_type:complete